MSSAPLIAAPNPTPASQVGNLARVVVRDLGAVFLTAIISLPVGLLINWLSSRPLPLVYQTPERRFDAELTSLVVAPPLALAPPATI